MECVQSSVKILKDNQKLSLRFDSRSVSGLFIPAAGAASLHARNTFDQIRDDHTHTSDSDDADIVVDDTVLKQEMFKH